MTDNLEARIRRAAGHALQVLQPNLSGLSKLREECAELVVAICRFEQGRGTADEIREECADVWLMLRQVEILFPFAADILTKLERLERRLELPEWEPPPPTQAPTDAELHALFRDFADCETSTSWRRKVYERCVSDARARR